MQGKRLSPSRSQYLTEIEQAGKAWCEDLQRRVPAVVHRGAG